jgi:hypothetical protein
MPPTAIRWCFRATTRSRRSRFFSFSQFDPKAELRERGRSKAVVRRLDFNPPRTSVLPSAVFNSFGCDNPARRRAECRLCRVVGQGLEKNPVFCRIMGPRERKGRITGHRGTKGWQQGAFQMSKLVACRPDFCPARMIKRAGAAHLSRFLSRPSYRQHGLLWDLVG